MAKKQVVGSMSDWSGVLKDFFRQIEDGSHTLASVKAFNNHLSIQEHRLITDDGTKKTSELLEVCRKLFPVWSYYSDKELDKMFPPVKTSRKFKNVQEADEDLKNKSANDLEKEGIKGITLRERIIFELEFFKETGEHLDVKNVTLCSGSRDSAGSVPRAYWHVVEFGVGRYGADDRDDILRSRQAVSC
jgi:hypothetical protein